MELNNNLQILIDKAWALHVEISDRIDSNNVSFCRFCSENGHCFGVTETPLEKESLISIRDSLKNVKNMLVFLQRLNSWQLKDRFAAIAQLEESRIVLIKKVTQYRGRRLEVMEDLNAYFGDLKTACDGNLKRVMEKEKKKKKKEKKMAEPTAKKGNCIWSLLRAAMKLILVSATVSAALKFCRTRQEQANSRRKNLSFVDSKTAGKKDFLLVAASSKSPFDVLLGRG